MSLRMTRMVLAVVLIGAAVLAAQAAVRQGAGTYLPRETRVAILPAINLTGEDMEELLGDVEMADHVTATLLLQRGFQVVADTEVLEAMVEAGMPAHDRAERTPELLSAVAQKVNARLVVSELLTDKRSSVRQRGFGMFSVYEQEGRAAARARVWDEAAKEFVCEKVATGVGDSGAAGVLAGTRSSDLREKALQLAVQDSVSELLAPHPVIVTQVDVSGRKSYRPAMAEALAVPETNWDPKETKVLVLPLLDETKEEKRDADSAQVAKKASECAAEEFAKCGFQVISGEQAAAGAEASGLDLGDEKARTRAAVRAVGEAAGADVVVTGSFLLSVLDRGKRIIKMEVKVYDMALGRYVIATVGSAGSTSRDRALSGAVHNVLEGCLSRYRA